MAYRSAVKSRKRITIILGLNLITVLLPFFLGCFELLVIFVHLMIGVSTGEWESWVGCLYWLAAFASIWVVSFLFALFLCKKRLIIDGCTLSISKGKEILYQCDISEVRAVYRARFSPFINSEPGSIVIVNYEHPVPKRLLLLMSWLSYKRICAFIKKANRLVQP